jgi:PilZ domain-containing protein
MPTVPTIAERRSQRITLDVPLVVKGFGPGNQAFREETFTLSASAHGVLLTLRNKVSLGQQLTLLNQKNWDECEGRVAYVGVAHGGLTRVGVEFATPTPEFWSLHEPPASWQLETAQV